MSRPCCRCGHCPGRGSSGRRSARRETSRRDEARLDAKALPDLLQKAPIVGKVAPRVVDPLLRHDLVEIFGEGHLVLGLLAVELDDAGQVLDRSESDIDRRRPDALQSGIAPYSGEKTRKIA